MKQLQDYLDVIDHRNEESSLGSIRTSYQEDLKEAGEIDNLYESTSYMIIAGINRDTALNILEERIRTISG